MKKSFKNDKGTAPKRPLSIPMKLAGELTVYEVRQGMLHALAELETGRGQQWNRKYR